MSKKGSKRHWAIVHIFSSYNNTIVTATDLSGQETFAKCSGGMVVKADRDQSNPYAAMQCGFRVANELKDKGISIFVGKPKASYAKYYLKNTKEVVEFMKRIARLLN